MSQAKARTTVRKKGSLLDGAPELVNHRRVAGLFDVTTAALRTWVEKGEFPEPHSVIAQTWFYRADWIAHRLKTGEWPRGVVFKD
jgi:hypothetical protein